MASMGKGRGVAEHASSSSSSSSSTETTIKLFGATLPNVLTYYLSEKGQAVPNAARRMTLSPGGAGTILISETTPFDRGVDMPSEVEWETKMAARDDHTLVAMSDFKDKDAVCQGYMSVVLTCSSEEWVEGDASNNWLAKKATVTSSLRFITTAYNIVGTKKAFEYVLHTTKNANAGGQIHVEQICMFRLQALLEALKAAGCTVTGVRGQVRFKGGMPTVCPGCAGTATSLGMTASLAFMKS